MVKCSHPGGSLMLVRFSVAPGKDSTFFPDLSAGPGSLKLTSDGFAVLCYLSDPSPYPKCSVGV